MVDIYWDYVNPIMGGLITLINLIEIIVIHKIRKKMSTSLIYILNLAISDLLVGAMVVSIKGLRDYYNNTVYKGHHVSRFVLEMYFILNFCFIRLSLINSVLTIAAITTDRWIALAKPFLYRRMKNKHAIFICIALWVISISVVATWYGLVRFYVQDKVKIEYELLVFPLLTLPILFALFFCYIAIMRNLQKHRREFNVNMHDHSYQSQREWIKLSIAVMITHFVCWTPVAIYGIIRAFKTESMMAGDLAFVIALLNSLLNPIVYFHHKRKEVVQVCHRIKDFLSHVTDTQVTNVLTPITDEKTPLRIATTAL